jgi:hypothetical protein
MDHGPLARGFLEDGDPCCYLLGTDDKAIPPALQRFMAERAHATIVEVPASHVSFLSHPDAATELILQAADATRSAGAVPAPRSGAGQSSDSAERSGAAPQSARRPSSPSPSQPVSANAA